MSLDIAKSAVGFFLFSIAELLFIGIPLVVFKLQKKSLKYEFRHRIIPNEMLDRNYWFRIVDILAGIFLGMFLYDMGRWLSFVIRVVVVTTMGEDFYHEAEQGSVNTTPPPPPPDPVIIWSLIVIGVILMFATVALAEEFFFRGVLLKEFGHKSKPMALFLSSVFFMLFHVFPGIVPWQTILTFWLYYFVFGVILGGITLLYKGDLVIVIIAHGVFNSIIWVRYYLSFLP